MILSVLEDPRDIRYPFGSDLYDDLLVVYHGTWSGYCLGIEREGLKPEGGAQHLPAIRGITSVSSAVGITTASVSVIRGLVPGIGRNNARAGIYFSQGFWHARAYATDQGGERVRLALKAADELLQMLDDSRIQMRHSREVLTQYRQQVEQYQSRLREETGAGHPVVYAVRVEREWCHKWRDRYDSGSHRFFNGNVRCDVPVPPDRILARADYTNGADSGYEIYSSFAMTWEQARALKV